jgi:hypothetical protein
MHYSSASGISRRISMRKILLALACVSALGTPSANSAGNSIRPGLWEITTSSDVLRLAQIAPERAQELKDLAEQYGVDISGLLMGEASSQVCITPEMAASDKPPALHDPEWDCNTQNATRSGNRYRYDFVCSSPQLRGKGTAEGTFTTPERFSGHTRFVAQRREFLSMIRPRSAADG